jgi:hypothetical protein
MNQGENDMKITRNNQDFVKAAYRVIVADPMIDGYEMIFENQVYLRAYLMREHKMKWNEASRVIRTCDVKETL